MPDHQSDMLSPPPAHSALGASGMDRWSHCPGSFHLGQRERHRLPTIHAATGTVAHDLVERALAEGDAAGTLDRARGTETTVDGHTVTVDDDMLDGVRVMLTYVGRRQQDLGVAPRIEQTVSVDGYFGPEEQPPVAMFGRADAQFLAGDLLEIVDYKNGSGVLVGVTDNPQLLYYAAGALLTAPGDVTAPRRVRLTVVQPNARAQEKITSYDLTTIDVLMWVAETLIPAVRACEAPDAPYVTGAWCRFCPVAHACPELLADAQTAAVARFDDTTPGRVLAENLVLAETVALWVDAVRGFALERAKAGMNIPGWEVVPTRPRRVWTDTDAVGGLLGNAQVDAWNHELKSPAQVEKLVGKMSGLWATVQAWVENRSSGQKIARMTGGFDDGDPF